MNAILTLIATLFVAEISNDPETTPKAKAREKLRLEVLSFPKEIHSKLENLGRQALLYHPTEAPKGKTPLVILLHGAGGTKRDVLSYRWRGDIHRFVERAGDRHVARVLVPQSRGHWSPTALNTLLDHVLKLHPSIDANRVYCIGYSMGGKGTWDWALLSPTRFAAIVPIAFIPKTEGIEKLRKLPIWAFAGTRDRRRARTVRAMTEKLKKLGADQLRSTIYDGVNHAKTDDKAWEEKDLFQWLFAQYRKPVPEPAPDK
ncbi:MAG: alpha/beta fold hydrolase [Planctomycetota bacterium]